MNDKLNTLLGRELFENIPFNVAVIDREFNIVAANRQFEEYFGDWKDRRCYEVYKGSYKPCIQCVAKDTFKDGKVRVTDGVGIDRHGIDRHYVAHIAPLMDADSEVQYVIEMTTDLTETRKWQREYDLLFDRVPCYITVINRDYKIIRANEKFRDTFGSDLQGKFCYEIYKKRKKPCSKCPAAQSFKDGAEHVSNQVGIREDGSEAQYIVNTSPLSRGEKGIAHVIEIATDISEIRALENQLRQSHDLYESLIQNSATGIVATDPAGNSTMMNPAARELFDWKAHQMPTASRLREMLPETFFEPELSESDFTSSSVLSKKHERIPVMYREVELKSRGNNLGRAAFLQDQRELKKLEEEKIDAERLGAVGQ
ncbi:PAS domain-containing protein, partial [Calditrichota bacterium]